MISKTEKCKICGTDLNGRNTMKLCSGCAYIELKGVKKRLRSSLIGGSVFSLIVFAVIQIIKMLFGDRIEYMTYTSPMTMDILGAINAVVDMSARAQTVVCAICFMVPFGYHAKLDYDTSRNSMSGSSGCAIGLAVFLIDVLISAVSGPFCFLHLLYKYIRLSLLPNKT